MGKLPVLLTLVVAVAVPSVAESEWHAAAVRIEVPEQQPWPLALPGAAADVVKPAAVLPASAGVAVAAAAAASPARELAVG
jgi:hypothetical protein